MDLVRDFTDLAAGAEHQVHWRSEDDVTVRTLLGVRIEPCEAAGNRTPVQKLTDDVSTGCAFRSAALKHLVPAGSFGDSGRESS